MTQTLKNFLETMRAFHEDNRLLEHFTRLPNTNDTELSTMPLTPFVYQFFLYNSLYQVDWEASLVSNSLRFHPPYDRRTKQGVKEPAQQKRFEDFMKKRDKGANYLLNAFRPLADIDLDGDWTLVVPDARVSNEDGKEFFDRMKELTRATINQDQNIRTGSVYSKVETCRIFVYNVRCNIFHGSKTLGETYEEDQRRRIKVYFEFLHALLTAFFSIVDSQQETMYLLRSPANAERLLEATRDLDERQNLVTQESLPE